MNPIDQRLSELGLALPKPVAPVATYVPYVLSGNMLYISGQTSVEADGHVVTGRLGEDLTVETGQKAARTCALNLIAQMKAACEGDLSRVRRIVKVGGFVCAAPTSSQIDIPKIINGCSDVMVAVFGEAGRHARFAVGSPSLPLDCAVEIDCVVEIA
ncbi:MAG TPA: RidA family protein [Hellea balneolensis]|uniref:RidA family protein n=1 Tax=Hellea balneolensis TaxID=287478 RepID=A0A7C5M0S0_9PROT|nr:RidA family protein [Hellea balneolensis]